MKVKLRNQERRSRDIALKISLSHIIYRYKRMPSTTQAFYQMACVHSGLVYLRNLYKKEVQYGGTDDFVYESKTSLRKFRAATKKDKPRMQQTEQDENQLHQMSENAEKMMTKMKERKSYTLSYERIVRAIVLI